MHLHLLHRFAMLCLSRGKKPICVHRPQPGARPSQPSLSRKPCNLREDEMSSSKHQPLTRSKHKPSLYVHPRTSSTCPPRTKISRAFSPFLRLSSRFMVLPAASSITRILATHPSRTCSPPLYLAHLPISSESHSTART